MRSTSSSTWMQPILRTCIALLPMPCSTLAVAEQLRNYDLSYENTAEDTVDNVGNVAGIVEIFETTGGRCRADRQGAYYYLRCTRPRSAAPPPKLTVGGVLNGNQVLVDTVFTEGRVALSQEEWVLLLIRFRQAAQRVR